MVKVQGWFIALLAAALTGCGPSTKLVPVSGVITLDGHPLANAHIAFQPDLSAEATGGGSFAFTDANGAYSLRTFDSDQPGAVVGRHRVEINLVVESDDRDPRNRPPAKTLPPKYNRNTELRFEILSGGTDKANFNLATK